MDSRIAGFADIDFLAKVENECFTDPWNESMLLSELNDLLAHYYIVSVDGVNVGYYSFLHLLSEAHIMNVAILPEYQGKGYGRMEMLDLLEKTLAIGAKDVTLEVRESNTKAIGLYESLGFIYAGKRPKYYMDGENALIYWLYR